MKKVALVLCVALLGLLTFFSFGLADNGSSNNENIKYGKVISIRRNISEPTEEYPFKGQLVELKITSGEYEGKIIEANNVMTGNPQYDLKVKPGQRVLISLKVEDGQIMSATIHDMARNTPLIILSILFLVTIVAIGGFRGLKSLISLLITILLIFTVLVPLLLRGYNPMLLTIALSAIITTVSLVLISGWQRKTLAAIMGIIGGTTCAGLLAFGFGHAAHLTGLGSQEAQMLGYIQDFKLNFQGILFASMLLGALGAVMDVGISIASAIEEVYLANPLVTPKDLFNAGMNVGKDIMGTMTNTLILAYTGSSLPLLLILVGYKSSLIKVINLDLIASEIIRALTGSMGLFIAIPLTALFSSWLIYKQTTKKFYG